MSTNNRGSRKGVPNVKETAEVVLSRCQQCDSTDAKKVGPVMVETYNGIHDGAVYDAITRQRVECLHCGQLRIDRAFRFTGCAK